MLRPKPTTRRGFLKTLSLSVFGASLVNFLSKQEIQTVIGLSKLPDIEEYVNSRKREQESQRKIQALNHAIETNSSPMQSPELRDPRYLEAYRLARETINKEEQFQEQYKAVHKILKNYERNNNLRGIGVLFGGYLLITNSLKTLAGLGDYFLGEIRE